MKKPRLDFDLDAAFDKHLKSVLVDAMKAECSKRNKRASRITLNSFVFEYEKKLRLVTKQFAAEWAHKIFDFSIYDDPD